MVPARAAIASAARQFTAGVRRWNKPILEWSVIILILVSLRPALAFAAPLETLREERTVTVDAHKETWRLVWTTPTVPACPVEALDISLTCPCAGFAYGEAGHLNLVRQRDGKEIDRLDLDPAFDLGENGRPDSALGRAVLQLWPRIDTDYRQTTDVFSGRPPDAFITAVQSRPHTQIMTFKNFDHDGQATEFLLQVGASPCGHTAWVAVGVSRNSPELHFLTSKERPHQPLVMPPDAWATLQQTSTPPPIVFFACGDHASPTESKVLLHAIAGRISAQRLTYACQGPHNETPGKLISRAPW